jgi:menaquinone-dependent protoporphyrinogen oxidase
MTRILIVFGTTDGHTRKVAQRLGQMVCAADSEVAVHVVEAGTTDVNPQHYSAVVVCASVQGGHYQQPVAKWVRANAVLLNAKRTAFVSVCLGILQHDAKVDRALDEIVQRFLDATGWRPAQVKKIAGALLYRDYNFIKRWMMKRIVRSGGGDTDTSRNYEYTDWNDLRLFAEKFVALVQPAREPVQRAATA